ncbi:ankyrin repeat, SAM and basic leucine zipper domain-containing protein 1-like [Macrosteles quadrilineatus]|uniref:ankyrin repeat, SAM and basic leucine zipper domain-containing protein 1-like n=1 Tax=Macrosteles quadrilineatus TaxID=74068 RepID=UPI0023E2794D|nr:ankyrin repeat, SAM and basic leucine zipper domain-containing protein 1-like [Macrosteles quadrilineatus]
MESHERTRVFGQEKIFKQNEGENVRIAQTLDALRLATIRGSLEDIKNTLSNGVTVNQPLKGGWTALMYACSLGHPSIVEYLLKCGANPNFHKELFTPLMAVCASTQKNEDHLVHCVESLLQYKAEVNTTERHHISALMFAAREGHVKIVEHLLNSSRCYIDAQDSQGWTALFWAANQRKEDVVKALVKHGAKVDIKDRRGKTVVDLVTNKEYDEILKILVKKEDRLVEKQEIQKDSDYTDYKTKEKFGQLVLQSLLEELTSPTINNINNNNNNNRNTKSFTKLMKNFELENNLDLLKTHEIILQIANSISGCMQNTLPFSHGTKIQQGRPLERSWKNVPYSAVEAQKVLELTVKHLEGLYANISYIRLHMQSVSGPALLEDKHARVSELTALSDKALRNSRLLFDELHFFHQYTKQLDGSDCLVPADFIKERNCEDHDRTHTIISATVIAAAAIFILFNTRTITLSFLSK